MEVAIILITEIITALLVGLCTRLWHESNHFVRMCVMMMMTLIHILTKRLDSCHRHRHHIWEEWVVFLIMGSVMAKYKFGISTAWLVVWKPLCLDPSDGVFGRFDLAALCGCHTVNVCCIVSQQSSDVCVVACWNSV